MRCNEKKIAGVAKELICRRTMMMMMLMMMILILIPLRDEDYAVTYGRL